MILQLGILVFFVQGQTIIRAYFFFFVVIRPRCVKGRDSIIMPPVECPRPPRSNPTVHTHVLLALLSRTELQDRLHVAAAGRGDDAFQDARLRDPTRLVFRL